MGAKYILRFDDVHYQMNWKIWNQIEEILISYGIKPVLAVIPDNKDEKLIKDNSVSHDKFWERIRYYNSLGWTIAMHGYEHKYLSKSYGDFVKINNYSEFAGLPEEIQKEKIVKAKEIFEKNGLIPEVFVAPAHTFDKTTIKILLEYRFKIINDGFFLFPRIRFGLIWIPQQLWWFKKMPFGLFTICFHFNDWQEKELNDFKKKIKIFKQDTVSLEKSIEIFPPKNFGFLDKFMNDCANFILRRAKLKND